MMADKSKIEWTDMTWNPVTGCTKVSQGCKNCYAERLWPKVEAAERKRADPLHWSAAPRLPFTTVRCHPERLDAPLHQRKPRRIFVNSMSDLFHEDVPFSFIDRVFETMLAHPRHQYQILTKRPQRMREYLMQRPHLRMPDHIWLGVSVEDQATADERIPLLLRTPAAVRFVSYEPALGPIQIRDYLMRTENIVREGPHDGDMVEQRDLLHWVIAGGESGPYARPSHPDWFRSVRDQCAAAGVPFFFKQWGAWVSTWHAQIEPNLVKGKPTVDVVPMCRLNRTNDSAPNYQLVRVGKKTAGRLLDGREHSEYPA